MKRILIIFLLIITAQSVVFAQEQVYTTDNLTVYELNKKYGLKDKDGKTIVYAQYKKLIRLNKNAWIVQKRNKFGLIDCHGNYLVQPKYTHVERIFDKFVKLGNDKDYGLYDQYGNVIIPHEFSSIEPLFGRRFLTCKNYKYGIYSQSGKKLLDNEFEYIYMPTPKTMRIKFNGNWYEIESITQEEALLLPEDIIKVKLDGQDFKVTNIFLNTGVGASYSVVTATDYLLKSLATISTAYEDSIDELMLSQGAETVSIFIKLSWIPKFPFIYAKKYYNNLLAPNKGPLADVRNELKEQLK